MKQTSTPASTKLVIIACDPCIDLRLPSTWWVWSMMILKQDSVASDAPPGSSLGQRGSHVRTCRAARDARLSRLPSLATRLAVTVHGHPSEAGNCDDLWIGPFPLLPAELGKPLPAGLALEDARRFPCLNEFRMGFKSSEFREAYEVAKPIVQRKAGLPSGTPKSPSSLLSQEDLTRPRTDSRL
jgi:hypothetical protein